MLYLPLYSADWEKLKEEMMKNEYKDPAVKAYDIPKLDDCGLRHNQRATYKAKLTPDQQAIYETFYAQADQKVYEAYVETRKAAIAAASTTDDIAEIRKAATECCRKHGNLDLATDYIIAAATTETTGKLFSPTTVYFGAHLYAQSFAERELQISVEASRRLPWHSAQIPSDKRSIYTAAYTQAIKKIQDLYQAARDIGQESTKKIGSLDKTEARAYLAVAMATLGETKFASRTTQHDRKCMDAAQSTLNAALTKSLDPYLSLPGSKDMSSASMHAIDYADAYGKRAIIKAQPEFQRKAADAKEEALRVAQEKLDIARQIFANPCISQIPFDPQAPAHAYIQILNDTPSFTGGVQAACARAYIKYITADHAESIGTDLYAQVYKDAAFQAYLQDHPIDATNPEIALEAAQAYADQSLVDATTIGNYVIARKKHTPKIAAYQNLAAARKEAAQRFHDKQQAKLGDNPLAPHLAIRNAARTITHQ